MRDAYFKKNYTYLMCIVKFHVAMILFPTITVYLKVTEPIILRPAVFPNPIPKPKSALKAEQPLRESENITFYSSTCMNSLPLASASKLYSSI